MERAAVSAFTPAAVAFTDGLGERHHILDPTGVVTLEVLCLRDDVAAVPSFEFALRERVSRLSAFRHASYGRIRAVERLTDRHATLAIVSDVTTGTRLSDLLTRSVERHINLDIRSALCLIRQLVPAVTALHEYARDVQGFGHGAIAPERLIVTPDGRLIVTEYAMGAALEQLHFPQERYWRELRVAVPRTAGLPRFDHRVDVTQIGIVALSLILGRLVRDDEYPARLGDVVASTWAISARGGFEPLPPGVRGWLGRALQLEARSAFASAAEARAELEKLLGDSEAPDGPASLEAFLARYNAADRPGPSRETDANATDGRPKVRLKADPTEITAPPEVRLKPELRLTSEVRLTSQVRLKADPTEDAAPPAAKSIVDDDRDARLFADEMPGRPRPSRRKMIVAAVLVAIVTGGVVRRQFFAAAPTVETTGTLVVTTNPPGVDALVDGEPRGTTPLTLTLASGAHVVELRGAGEPRTIPVTITAGTQASQYIELPRTAPSTGQLQIQTEPAGARVTVDGQLRGTSPVVVSNLSAGEHGVVVESDRGSVRESVIVESGITASLVVPLPVAPEAPATGWLSVSAPIDVQIFAGGQLLGTNLSERIVVPAGRHDLEIVNDTVGYRLERTVQVAPGKVASIAVEMPKGTIALNALPWAEVWIDGEKIGETPIGNLPISIGSHSVVFRHPELGEQHHTAVVTLQAPTRVSVDLRPR